MTRFARIFAALAIVLSTGAAGSVDTVLVVQVKLDDQPEKVIAYSMADLLKLPQRTLVTGNDYVDGTHRFSGPMVRDLAAAVGAQAAGLVKFTASNDYTVEIDMQEFQTYPAIFALTMDDVEFSPRDKGPIWVMYPISDYKELLDPFYNSRLIWQLDRVVFE